MFDGRLPFDDAGLSGPDRSAPDKVRLTGPSSDRQLRHGPGRTAASRQAAVDPSQNVVLEASAGTGKTRVLVERYVNLLLAGVDPGNILAITFTRKAAAEMRQRIVERLKEAEPLVRSSTRPAGATCAIDSATSPSRRSTRSVSRCFENFRWKPTSIRDLRWPTTRKPLVSWKRRWIARFASPARTPARTTMSRWCSRS